MAATRALESETGWPYAAAMLLLMLVIAALPLPSALSCWNVAGSPGSARVMIRRVNRTPGWLLYVAAFLLLLFLLLPVGAILGLGLYYILGIFLVADISQMMAALAKESGIAPALAQTPLIALAVTILASAWGFALSLTLAPLDSGPPSLAAAGLGAPVPAAALRPRRAVPPRLPQARPMGRQCVGIFTLVVLARAAIAAPLVAAILCLGWRRVDPAWRAAALEAGADEVTIFRRLTWPHLKPYTAFSSLIAFILSLGDFISRQFPIR